MRVLWLCNIVLPLFAEELLLPGSHKEGWLSGLMNSMIAKKGDHSVELGVCFPIGKKGVLRKGTVKGIPYYGFHENTAKETAYEAILEQDMQEILEDFKPDVIHIFGTEYAHSYAMAKVFGKPNRILVGIQGLCELCAKHYAEEIPNQIQKRFLLRDFLKQDNIIQQKRKFEKRGKREKALLKKAGHITGRTALDQAFVEQNHSHANYHFMNETLRSNFYGEEWSMEQCKPHTILMSQGDYPLKGLHVALEALAILKKDYPDVSLQVAGNQITQRNTWKEKLKLSSYGKYILDLIKKDGLENSVEFLGMLDAAQMCMELKKTHVFLNASFMENSPNALGEAMLMGVPCVSSYVGGVPSMFTHAKEGYCYPANEPSMLAYYVKKMFHEEETANQYSKAAKERAQGTHDSERNRKRLLEIYETIVQS